MAIIGTAALVCCVDGALGNAGTISYYPASFEVIPSSSALLTVFPGEGPKIAVPLPLDLPDDFRGITFGLDGRTIFGQRSDPNAREGITRIDLSRSRKAVVAGSDGFGSIWFVSGPQPSGGLLVSGWSKMLGRGECGTYGIDPKTGQSEAVLIGVYPECGGGAGPPAPDGGKVLGYSNKQLRVTDLKTRSFQPIGPGNIGAWSPDGKWIAAILGQSGTRELILVDASNTSVRRRLGRAPEDGQPVWSPDSRYLLVQRTESRCGEFLSSLDTIDTQSGKRAEIRNSDCALYRGIIGWVDRQVIPQR
jgi:hypothetical protein